MGMFTTLFTTCHVHNIVFVEEIENDQKINATLRHVEHFL